MNIDEHIIFYNKSVDLFGNDFISQYYIYKYDNKLILVYSKPYVTREDCICELLIETINTIKDTTTGEFVIPGFISVGDKLEGTCADGYCFNFENIIQFERKKGGYCDGRA